MKRKDYKDLREKSIKDLLKLVSSKQKDAIKKKMQILSGREKNLKVHRILRGEIAKILTLVREKEIIAKLSDDANKAKK